MKFSATLAIASVIQSVNVQDSDTLLDTINAGESYQLGAPALRDWAATVVGGLFLGEDASDLLNSNKRTWVSQDQRHTAHAQVRYQPWSRFRTALGASYGTGVPVDLNGVSSATLVDQFGQAVVDRINFSDGRVRPSLAVDLSTAADLYQKESRSLRIQGDIRNLNDRLNLINFASVFSGTAIAAPRTFSLRLRFDY